MNPVGQASGNEDVTEGRDIPWLQDVDANNDDTSDNWLEAWPAVYRDVVIVDANGVVADTYNLTINSLEEPNSYATLRQMLIDVATEEIGAIEDAVSVVSNATSEIDVLANDKGRSRLSITSLTQPEHGTAEIATIEYAAHLDPTHWTMTELLISEIVPDEYIEIYNTSFTDSIDLGDATQTLVSGDFNIGIAAMSDDVLVPRSYLQLDWPDGLEVSWESGELILYKTAEHGFENGTNMDDFVAWGELIGKSRIELARKIGKWDGEQDGILDLNAIQRIPGTIGNEPHSYDNHRPSTPGNAINDAIEVEQVIRYTPAESFVGEVELTYTVTDDDGVTDSATVRIIVDPDKSPWQNPDEKYDVNDDGNISIADAQAVIDVLNSGVSGQLPSQIVMPFGPTPFVDCDGNGGVEPLDALLIINHLLASTDHADTAGQGEPEPATESSAKESDTLAGQASIWQFYAQTEWISDDQDELVWLPAN